MRMFTTHDAESGEAYHIDAEKVICVHGVDTSDARAHGKIFFHSGHCVIVSEDRDQIIRLMREAREMWHD